MSASRSVIRKLYRDAILQVFGCGDKELDTDLTRALKSDVHLGGKDPGQWSGKGAVLSIYCENGIPNASDIHDFTHEYREFGIEGNPVSYNSEKWFKSMTSSISIWKPHQLVSVFSTSHKTVP